MFVTKLKRLYLPFLICSLGSIGFILGIQWLVDVFIELELKVEVLNYLLPMLLGGVLVLLVLRNKMKLMVNDRWSDFVGFLLWSSLSLGMILSLHYVSSQQAQFTRLDYVSDIHQHRNKDYFEIPRALIKNNYGSMWTTSRSSNRYGTELTFSCHFACPLLDDTLTKIENGMEVNQWLAVTFFERVPNRAGDNEYRQELIDSFIQESIERFKFHKFDMSLLKRIDASDQKDALLKAIDRTSFHVNKTKLVILKESPKSMEEIQSSNLPWVLGVVGGSNLLWLILVLMSRLKPADLKNLNSSASRKKTRKETQLFFHLLIPHKEYWASPSLFLINVLVFLIMIASGVSLMHPQSDDLILWGGNIDRLSFGGEYWRLLTSVFVHGGIVHLSMNMMLLILLGILMESAINSGTYAIVYILSGLSGSIASAYFNENTVSVGASGAIFGLLGMSMVLIMFKLLDKSLLRFILILIGLNLLMSISGMIDSAAHIGGLFGGMLSAFFIFGAQKLFSRKL